MELADRHRIAAGTAMVSIQGSKPGPRGHLTLARRKAPLPGGEGRMPASTSSPDSVKSP